MNMCVGRRGLTSSVVHVVLPMESDAYSYRAGTRVKDKFCITKLIQCPVVPLQCRSVASFQIWFTLCFSSTRCGPHYDVW